MIYDVIVIGAGAAGLMAGAESARRGLSTLLLERNSRPARKMMITGKGRCNVTNFCDVDTFIKNVRSNPRFLYSAVNALTPQDLMKIIEQQNVPLKVERGNRVFPVSDKAVDIVDAVVGYCKKSGAEIFQAEAQKIRKNSDGDFEIISSGDITHRSKSVIIATGGKSYPQTGSVGDGYRFAESFGHSIVGIRPSLIPIVTNEKYCADMMGLSLKNVTLTLTDKSKKKPKQIFNELGELLFTHFGISGPLVLSASTFIDPLDLDKYSLLIDFKPGLTLDALDKRIQKDFVKYSNRDFANALDDLLPSKAIAVMVELSGIGGETKVNQISKKDRLSFANLLKNFPITIKELRPIKDAVVTAGGVSVKEINPATMESKIVPNLYFAGEVIDLDGYTGGFNLQIAFSTGFVAGNSVLMDLN